VSEKASIQEETPTRSRSFDTPRLMDSYRLDHLHEQTRFQTHWFIGMLFAWLRHWYEGCRTLLTAMPKFLWPVVIFLATFFPASIIVLPVSALIYTNGKKLVGGIIVSVPTPKQAIREMKRFMSFIKARFHRFVIGAERRWAIIVAAIAIDYWRKPKKTKRR
jgi:hypothetical protein